MLAKSLWEGDAGKGQNQRKQSEQQTNLSRGRKDFINSRQGSGKIGRSRATRENVRKDWNVWHERGEHTGEETGATNEGVAGIRAFLKPTQCRTHRQSWFVLVDTCYVVVTIMMFTR